MRHLPGIIKPTIFVLLLFGVIPCFSQRRVKIMPLGTSITAADSIDPSYRYFIWKALLDSGLAERVDFVGVHCGCGNDILIGDVINRCGHPAHPSYAGNRWDWDHNGNHGIDLPNVLTRCREFFTLNNPDIALVELGVNDLVRPVDTITAHMNLLIDSLRRYNPSVHILLANLIPKKSYSASLLALNQAYLALAALRTTLQSPVELVDQYTGFNPATMLRDNVHPNAVGQETIGAKWVTALLPVIRNYSSTIEAALTVHPDYADSGAAYCGTPVVFRATAGSFAGIRECNLFVDSSMVTRGAVDDSGAYLFSWAPESAGTFILCAVATDHFGATVWSAPLSFTVPEVTVYEMSIMAINRESLFPEDFYGKAVRTGGIVTGIAADSSIFWIQDPNGDGLSWTSDALPVDCRSDFRADLLPVIGDSVRIVGAAEKYRPDMRAEFTTRITSVDSIAVISSANTLPAPFFVNRLPGEPTDLPLLAQKFREHAGMLIGISNAVAAGPCDHEGRWPVALSGNQRFASRYAAAPCGSIFLTHPGQDGLVDYNTECFLIGSKTMPSAPVVHAGDTVYRCTGILEYDHGMYVLQPHPDSLAISAPHVLPPAPVGGIAYVNPSGFRVVSVDCGGLFDTLNATDNDVPAASAADLAVKIAKYSRALVDELFLPDLVCIRGIETPALIGEIVRTINTAVSSRYRSACIAGSSPSGRHCAFMFDTTKCQLEDFSLLYAEPFGNSGECLIGKFTVNLTPWTVIIADLIDRSSDTPLFHADSAYRPSEICRNAQAVAIRTRIDEAFAENSDARILIAGTFNDHPFNEIDEFGGANPSDIISGAGVPGATVLLTAWQALAEKPWLRYTACTAGRFEFLDNVMVSPSLLSMAKSAAVLHFNAGFDRSYATDPLTSVKAFSNDPIEIRF